MAGQLQSSTDTENGKLRRATVFGHVTLGGRWAGPNSRRRARFDSAHKLLLTTSESGVMNTTKLFALILIGLGVVALAYQGFTYTTREKVVDLGPLQVTSEKTKTVPLPPIIGGFILIGGIALLVVNSKKT
jgi:hypothetical protein